MLLPPGCLQFGSRVPAGAAPTDPHFGSAGSVANSQGGFGIGSYLECVPWAVSLWWDEETCRRCSQPASQQVHYIIKADAGVRCWALPAPSVSCQPPDRRRQGELFARPGKRKLWCNRCGSQPPPCTAGAGLELCGDSQEPPRNGVIILHPNRHWGSSYRPWRGGGGCCGCLQVLWVRC